MKITETLESLTQVQKFLVAIIVVLITYFVSAALSYGAFSKAFESLGLVSSGIPGPTSVLEEDPNEPKTEECPLNGRKHTKKAKDTWEKRRPLAVMIENHEQARPQSGLSSADIVYEAVAEGGITRFMAIFYCNLNEVQIGPVRSARTYYLDWLGEYDALYAHVGGANTPGPADALGQIIRYGVKDLNQFSIGFPVFWRDYQRPGHLVATEHTMYSTTAKLWEIGVKRGWVDKDEDGIAWDKNFKKWQFKEPAPDSSGQVTSVNVSFWGNQSSYNVEWNYDSTTNTYKRKNNNEPHTDLNNKKQLEAKNIVIQFETERNANDGYENNVHLLYGTTGKGKALIIQDGKVIEGNWSKVSRTARSLYTDSKGVEIKFARGTIWIETVPEGADVKY